MNPASRASRAEWLALGVAAVVAHGFYWRIVLYPSDFDAKNYLDIAADLARNGLFSKFYYSNVRTYGYPLLLRALRAIAGGAPGAWGFAIFEAQLVLYLGAALVLRWVIAGRYPRFAPWLLGALVLNPFALSYTPESLTESVSASLLILGAACWMRLRLRPAAPWWTVLLGSVLLSFAVMVRPADVFALAAWWLAVGLAGYEARWRPRAVLAATVALVVGSALPMAPQYVNNVRYWGAHTPLVAAQLAHNQQIWGIQYLKYATAMPPVPTPSIFYPNPLVRNRSIDEAHPLRWYLRYPVAGSATLALHVFNLLDQDLLFTYSRDLDPWYRWPLGMLGHAAVALALVAALLIVRRRHNPGVAVTGMALAGFTLAHVAVHATTAVEMRFGLPLLVVAGPLAVWAVRELAQAQARRWRAPAAAFVVLYVALAMSVSGWVRNEAPAIRGWAAEQHAHP